MIVVIPWYFVAWSWLKKNWKWLIFPLGILLFIVGRMTKKTVEVDVVSDSLHEHSELKEVVEEELKKDLEAVTVETDTRLQKIDEVHQETVRQMTEDQKAEAEKLRKDPEQLEKYLLNVGRDIRG